MTTTSQAIPSFEPSEPTADRAVRGPVSGAPAAFDVFISYSHVDKTTADATCATLEQAGIRCWIAPRDIVPGDDWGAAIVKAIDRCRAMVLIFSSNANESKQIRREVERAVNAGTTIIPVRIENVAPTEAMAYFMSTVHWLDAMTAPLDDHLRRLTASIKALLQAQAPEPLFADQNGARDTATLPDDAASASPNAKPMFQEIMNFSYQRTRKQAFGWYLMYLLIGIVVGFTVGRIAGVAGQTPTDAAQIGLIAGQLSAIPYHLALGVLLIWHRPKDASSLMMVLGSVILSIALGALGGLIPLAALSRRPIAMHPRIHSPRLGLVSPVH